jgi:hypothetical protein
MKGSDSILRHRSSFPTVTENHVKANYGDMKKWGKKSVVSEEQA